MAPRTVSDAQVLDAVRDIVWRVNDAGIRVMTPEGLYGRRKMTSWVRQTVLPDASAGAVDRAMRSLGLQGVRRTKTVRTTIPAPKDQEHRRAGDLLDRDFTAAAPDRVWVTDFTYVRTWLGFVYVAFILDVYAQRIVAWHASTSKVTDLVMTPLRMAIWQRDHEGRPVDGSQLIHHSDAGSQGGIQRSSRHLDDGGVWWDDRGSICRSSPKGHGGSGQRIGHCGRRCGRQGGPSRPGRYNVRSGD